ncbi:hypothetical protein GCM10023322_57740 [Rugosimonospora acidiphila]|uniref:Uncharacterized protein n=1 Tax=Rugosimonospora acidiphila TaxID=556531 RepID=A0ABP9SFH0_9ACTN
MHIRRIVTVLALAMVGVVSVASPALAWATTLCVCPNAITAHVGEQFNVTLTATNQDNAGRVYRIHSTDLSSYTDLVSCAGSPVAVTASTCASDGGTGYQTKVPISSAASGENVTFTLLATAVHSTQTVTAEVVVGGIVQASATFTITVLDGRADLKVKPADARRDAGKLAVTFVAENLGPSSDPHAKVTVSADSWLGGVVRVNDTDGFDCDHHGSVATCTKAPMDASHSARFEVDYQPGLLLIGTFGISIQIDGTNDPDLSNNHRTLRCTFVTGLLSGCA